MDIELMIQKAEKCVQQFDKKHNEIIEHNSKKVLDAFIKCNVGNQHLGHSSGYGYDDIARDKLEELYATVFDAEAALVRQQIISGTHAITLALSGNLNPGEELVYLGTPYDTLQTVIGHNNNLPGTLSKAGIKYREFDLDYENFQINDILSFISAETKIIAIQRSRGYSWRNSLTIEMLEKLITPIKEKFPDKIIFVDNCYGEMTDKLEPTNIGADLIAGSLIKNLGSGLVPNGGYVVGKEELVENAAYKLTVPGCGREVGASITDNRPYYEALFLSPMIVGEALKGAVFAASMLEQIGFEVSPAPTAKRADIIQAINMKNSENLIAFCQGIQSNSPIDSYALPMPSPMPGYDCDIIMAAGSFIQGSTIELSADAPLREPFTAYMQGGLNYYHVKYAIINTIKDMYAKGLI